VASLTEQKGLAALAFLGVAERLADTRGTVQFAGWVLSAGIVGTRGCADRSCLAELGSSELLGSSRLEAWTRKIEATTEQSRHQEPLSDRCFHRNAVETGAVAAPDGLSVACSSTQTERTLLHRGETTVNAQWGSVVPNSKSESDDGGVCRNFIAGVCERPASRCHNQFASGLITDLHEPTQADDHSPRPAERRGTDSPPQTHHREYPG
jgi:hypothetical protein